MSSNAYASSRILPGLAVALLASACGGPRMSVPASPDAPRPAFASVTPAQWQALESKRFYFGHQSVGGNIMDGVAAVLAAHPEIKLRVVQGTHMDSAPGLFHARIGRNGDPGSKTAAFDSIVDQGRPAVAMLKFCYVDTDNREDPDSLFAAYQQNMASLRSRHPGLVLVHATMPLTVVGDGRLDRLKKWFKREPTHLQLNTIRNRYNALLRQAYVGKEPVFDLARFESTRPDGSRAFVMNGSDTVFVMASENTADGGHLTAAAGRGAAEEFLAVLATLEGPAHP